ncbi:hypothetical protein Peur_023409 [Populus x canadensis]
MRRKHCEQHSSGIPPPRTATRQQVVLLVSIKAKFKTLLHASNPISVMNSRSDLHPRAMPDYLPQHRLQPHQGLRREMHIPGYGEVKTAVVLYPLLRRADSPSPFLFLFCFLFLMLPSPSVFYSLCSPLPLLLFSFFLPSVVFVFLLSVPPLSARSFFWLL